MNVKMLSILFVAAFFASTTTFAGDQYKSSDPNQEQSQKQAQKQGQKQSQSAKAVAKASAYAGNTDIDNRNVNKVNIDNRNINKNSQSVVVNDGDVNFTTGDVTLETGDVSLETGDVNLETGDILIEAQEVLPGVLHVGTPYLPEPPLFNESVDAAEGGLVFDEWFNEKCPTRFTREKPLKSESDNVRGTRVVWSPHQNHQAKAKRSKSDNVLFLLQLPEDKQRCLGSVTAESESKTIQPMRVIRENVAKHVLKYVKGVGQINLIAIPKSATANRSVTTSAGGLNLLTSITKAFTSDSAVAGLGGGGALNRGKSFTRALLGNTWLVTTPDPNGISIPFRPKPEVLTDKGLELPQAEDVSTQPEPTSPPVVETIILDRDPNDFGSRQIKYVNPQ